MFILRSHYIRPTGRIVDRLVESVARTTKNKSMRSGVHKNLKQQKPKPKKNKDAPSEKSKKTRKSKEAHPENLKNTRENQKN